MKIRTLEDCRNGRDMEQVCQAQEGAETKKVGSFIHVHTDLGDAYIPDTNRDLRKPIREQVIKMLEAIGIGVCLVVMLVSLTAFL